MTTSSPFRLHGRLQRFRAPLPLNDFDGYDGYWGEERRESDEPEIRPRWKIAVDMIPDGSNVLDVGCGTGGFLTYLLSQRPNCKVRGTDISPGACEVARQSGLDAFAADLTTEPLDGEYDYVTCFETIEHIHEAEKVLVAMRDVTRQKLIMSLPNVGFIESRVRLGLFGRFPNTTILFHAKEHIRHWTPKDFTDWTAHFGLRVTEIQGQWGPRYLPWKRWPTLCSPQVVYTLERA